MNLPNKITVFRFCLIPVFTVVFMLQNLWAPCRQIALVIFIVASLSDFFDGYLARKNNQVTDFGKLMDPLADKMLVTTALVCFVQFCGFPCWCAILIILREFIISGLRQLAAEKKIIIMASYWGKTKTVVQLIMCILYLLHWTQYGWFMLLEKISVWAAAILTVISLIDYIIKNKEILRQCSK